VDESRHPGNFFDAHAHVRRAREKFLAYAQFRYRQFLSDPEQQPHAVACVYLNNWQGYRDRFGYAGLEALNHQVERLVLPQLGSRDICARFNDSALVTVLCAEHGRREPLGWCQQQLEQLASAVYRVDDHQISATFSIGLCWFDRRVLSAEEALYDASHIAELLAREGRNQVRQFQPAQTRQRPDLDEDQVARLIRDSLDTSHMRIVFQPLLGWQTGRLRHYQAWARLITPDGHELRARDFLDSARRDGSLPRLNRWTLRRALHFLASDPGLADRVRLFVNASLETFDARLLDWLARQLEQHPHCRQCLVCELDEFDYSSRDHDRDALVPRLAEMGLRCGLTGVTAGNLERCKRYWKHFDYMRMAPGFDAELDRDRALGGEFSALIDSAHAHGVLIIMAELETEDKIVEFWKQGVDLIQSDFFEHPREMLRSALE